VLVAIAVLVLVLLLVLIARLISPKQKPQSMTRLRREQIDRLIRDNRVED